MVFQDLAKDDENDFSSKYMKQNNKYDPRSNEEAQIFLPDVHIQWLRSLSSSDDFQSIDERPISSIKTNQQGTTDGLVGIDKHVYTQMCRMPSISRKDVHSLASRKVESDLEMGNPDDASVDEDQSISSISNVSSSEKGINDRDDNSVASSEGGSFIDHAHSIMNDEIIGSISRWLNNDTHSLDESDSPTNSSHTSIAYSSKSSIQNRIMAELSPNEIEYFVKIVLAEDWSNVFSYLDHNPLYSRVEFKSNDANDTMQQYPLNIACARGAPIHIIKALVDAWPVALCKRSDNQTYPLHELLRRKDVNSEILEHIIRANLNCIHLLDGEDRLPIQVAYFERVRNTILCSLYKYKPEVDDLKDFDDENKFNLHMAMGTILCNQKQYHCAKVEFSNALENSTSFDPIRSASVMILISTMNRKLMEYKEADKFVGKAISILLEFDQSNEKIETGHAYFESGLVQYKLKKFRKALKNLSSAGVTYINAGIPKGDDLLIRLRIAVRKVYKALLKVDEGRKDTRRKSGFEKGLK